MRFASAYLGFGFKHAIAPTVTLGLVPRASNAKFEAKVLRTGLRMTCGGGVRSIALAAIGGVLLAACGPTQSSANAPEAANEVAASTAPLIRTVNDIDFTQYSRDLARFTELSQGQSRIAAIDVIRLLFAPQEGAKIIKTSTAEYDLEGGSVMLLSAQELADDSVRAQEFYLIFEGQGYAQKLADYGLRVKCYRGENTMDWQAQACP